MCTSGFTFLRLWRGMNADATASGALTAAAAAITSTGPGSTLSALGKPLTGLASGCVALCCTGSSLAVAVLGADNCLAALGLSTPPDTVQPRKWSEEEEGCCLCPCTLRETRLRVPQRRGAKPVCTMTTSPDCWAVLGCGSMG